MRVLILTCLLGSVDVSFGFLPNPFSAIDLNDYTHTDITEIGILKVSVYMLSHSGFQRRSDLKSSCFKRVPRELT